MKTVYGASGIAHQALEHSHYRDPRRRRKKGTETVFEKKKWLKTPQPGEDNRHTSPGSTESPNDDEPKDTRAKAHTVVTMAEVKETTLKGEKNS